MIGARVSAAEGAFAMLLQLNDITGAEREYEFHPERRWRLDFAWPDKKVAVEIEGLTYDGGRHQRIAGYKSDLDKYNAALMMGWTVYRIAATDVYKNKKIMAPEQHIENLKRLLGESHE